MIFSPLDCTFSLLLLRLADACQDSLDDKGNSRWGGWKGGKKPQCFFLSHLIWTGAQEFSTPPHQANQHQLILNFVFLYQNHSLHFISGLFRSGCCWVGVGYDDPIPLFPIHYTFCQLLVWNQEKLPLQRLTRIGVLIMFAFVIFFLKVKKIDSSNHNLVVPLMAAE